MLAASGITPEHAARRGYETIDDKRRLAELKIVTAARSHIPGLLVPTLRPDGSMWGCQYRPDEPRLRDGRLIKYETPWQQRNGLDVPPGVGPMLADPTIPLFITEGAKKADCGAMHRLCIVALVGVWCWLGTNSAGGKMALPDWRDVALNNGRRVIIGFDGDVARKPSVRIAMKGLAAYLAIKGAHVEYLWLPDTPGDKTGLFTTAAPVTNPLRTLVAAALDDDTDDKEIDTQFETAAIRRLVSDERRGSTQQVEAELLRVFCERLESGGADAVLTLLRKPFNAAAKTLRDALAVVNIPNDPQEFMNSATPEELVAWQSVKPAVATLDRIAAIARMLGPNGVFPLVSDPRATDPGLEAGWLDSRAAMCTDGDLMAASMQFQRPSPAADVRASPWLRVTPHLHTVASAAERIRSWAESEWAAREAQRPTSGRLRPDGSVAADVRRNPFAVTQ